MPKAGVVDVLEHEGLVGRAEDLARLKDLVDEHRLVTIVGAGGAGKTKLARALGALIGRGPERTRTVFADLTEAVSLEGALGAVAGALGAGLGTADVDTGVRVAAEAMASKGPLLLILDNVEQLEEKAGRLASAWVEQVTTLKVVVTSRVALGLANEKRLELPPLPVGPAVELFLARAGEARPGFEVAGADRALLEELVDALDRLPLAIELAAARLEVLTLAELKARLERDPGVLARPGREGRHGAMRAVLEASWRLLSGDEQAALARLSVFAGGFDLDAAQKVLSSGVDALDVVHALKRKSLIQPVAHGERSAMRYRLLETIRQFARERLEALGAAEETLRRHAEHFGERASYWLKKRDIVSLSEDIENLAAAVERARGLAPAAAARVSLGLDLVLAARGPLAARRRFLEAGYEAAEASGDRSLIARLLIARGEAARAQGETQVAIEWIQRAISLADQLGDRGMAGRGRSALGTARLFLGDAAGAQECWSQALDDLNDDPSPVDRGIVLARVFGMHLARGHFDRATEPLGREALEIFRKAGDRRWENIARMNLAVLCSELGDLDRAEELLQQGLENGRAVGDRVSMTMYTHNLGLLEIDRGDHEAGEAHLREAFALARETGDARVAGFAAGCLGIARALAGAPQEAVPLLSEGRQIAEQRGEAALAHLFDAWSAAVKGVEVPAPLAADVEGNASFAQAARILGGAVETPLGIHPRIASRYRGLSSPASARRVLTLLAGGLRFRVGDGEEIDLSRRGSLRRLLLALVDAREVRPDQTLDVHQLLDAGWPGERVLPEAGANRVYTAIRHLRNMGMKDVLMTRDGGYLIDPEVEVRREGSGLIRMPLPEK